MMKLVFPRSSRSDPSASACAYASAYERSEFQVSRQLSAVSFQLAVRRVSRTTGMLRVVRAW